MKFVQKVTLIVLTANMIYNVHTHFQMNIHLPEIMKLN